MEHILNKIISYVAEEKIYGMFLLMDYTLRGERTVIRAYKKLDDAILGLYCRELENSIPTIILEDRDGSKETLTFEEFRKGIDGVNDESIGSWYYGEDLDKYQAYIQWVDVCGE